MVMGAGGEEREEGIIREQTDYLSPKGLSSSATLYCPEFLLIFSDSQDREDD